MCTEGVPELFEGQLGLKRFAAALGPPDAKDKRRVHTLQLVRHVVFYDVHLRQKIACVGSITIHSMWMP